MSDYKDTVHKSSTKFGFKTPHKFPTAPREVKQLLDLTDQLYPTGRAWRLFNGNHFEQLHKAINESFLQLREDCLSFLNSAIPDNEEFDEKDCIYWEGKLGLISNPNLTIELRKQIIVNKLSFPRNIKARQSLAYIQKQIELYGFTDVKVYANIFYDINGQYYYMTPLEVGGNAIAVTQHGGITQHGNSTQHGDGNFEVIANEAGEESYSTGGNQNLWATFFIASPNGLYQKGTVDANRKQEFRELILKLKPAHLVAFTFINYV
jgi:hypothetical protein